MRLVVVAFFFLELLIAEGVINCREFSMLIFLLAVVLLYEREAVS